MSLIIGMFVLAACVFSIVLAAHLGSLLAVMARESRAGRDFSRVEDPPMPRFFGFLEGFFGDKVYRPKVTVAIGGAFIAIIALGIGLFSPVLVPGFLAFAAVVVLVAFILNSGLLSRLS